MRDKKCLTLAAYSLWLETLSLPACDSQTLQNPYELLRNLGPVKGCFRLSS